MHLKRKILHECIGNPRIQKAVSIALLLKQSLGRTSSMHNWSVNKLHNLTGISASTINKYMPVMKAMDLVHFCGKNNEHLVASRLSSHRTGGNIDVSQFDLSSYKGIYNSLRAFVALAIQHRKDFIRHTIQTYHNPRNNKELKKARKILKRLVSTEVLKSVDSKFTELGTSYKRIAQETGNCIRTAQRIIRYAVNKGWCLKKSNYEVYYLKDVCFRKGGDLFTYSTKNYIFIMHPNKYTLSSQTSLSLGGGGY